MSLYIFDVGVNLLYYDISLCIVQFVWTNTRISYIDQKLGLGFQKTAFRILNTHS